MSQNVPDFPQSIEANARKYLRTTSFQMLSNSFASNYYTIPQQRVPTVYSTVKLKKKKK
jgi:hypothetical protein